VPADSTLKTNIPALIARRISFFWSIEFKLSSQNDQTGMWDWAAGKALSASLEHDPEKWIPVFREDHAQSKS
jgi:hypothetical protein